MNKQPNTTPIKNSQSIIAIDVSKDSLEVLTAEQSFSVENSPRGFAALQRKISAKPNRFVVFEATGGYERALTDFLHASKVDLCIVNPRLVRAFAISEGIKAKTDPIDVRMIYRFADSKVLRPTPAPSPEQRELSDLLDRRCQLSEFLAREKNRIQKAPDKTALASQRRHVKWLEKELALLETHIQKLVEKAANLKKACQIMTSVKGVGKVTAWTILGHIPEMTRVSRNELVALAGVAPFNRDSGKQVGKRYIGGGRAKIRRVLFMAARTASQFNPVIRSYVEGLVSRGKAYKCARIAAIRKILIHLQALLKQSEVSPC